jgi:hypothetical protein
MSLEIAVAPSIAPITLTPQGNSWLEIGSPCTLSSSLGKEPVAATWSESSKGSVAVVLPTQPLGTCQVIARGFGKVKITATYKNDQVDMWLWVGTVVIAGADGDYWQVYADGSIKKMEEKDLSPTIVNMVKDKVIIADLTGNSSATAVTCYLLNLKSFNPMP